MGSKKEKICLSNLYKDEDVRNMVWTVLAEDFEMAFERLVKEAKSLRSSIGKIAINNKFKVKDMFIEYGYKMTTLNDLKVILDNIPDVEDSWHLEDCDY